MNDEERLKDLQILREHMNIVLDFLEDHIDLLTDADLKYLDADIEKWRFWLMNRLRRNRK